MDAGMDVGIVILLLAGAFALLLGGGLWISALQGRNAPVDSVYEPGDLATVQQRLHGIEGDDLGVAEFRARNRRS